MVHLRGQDCRKREWSEGISRWILRCLLFLAGQIVERRGFGEEGMETSVNRKFVVVFFSSFLPDVNILKTP